MNDREIITNFPIAYESPDHLNPWGTKRDLSRQLRFESKLYKFMEHKKFNNILDLGCSGGAYICNMHDLGFFAIGLEGSDFSKKYKRGPWAYLSDYVLFTCDITKPFEIIKEKKLANMDIISSFEVLEHLKENQIVSLFENINTHSHQNTRLIFSIALSDDIIDGVNLHQTVKPKSWWIEKFSNLGWVQCKYSMKFFNGQYLRGKRFGSPDSFEVILKKKECDDEDFPKLNFIDRIIDLISGSKLQKALFKIVHGDSTYNSY